MARKGISGARVIAEMVSFGAESRYDLCKRLEMSKASITRITDILLNAGLVKEGEKFTNSGRGRKTTSLNVRPELGYMIGTDLEGMAVCACVLDCSKHLISSGKRAVGSSWSMARIIEAWQGLIKEVIDKSKVSQKKIIGLGVGVPGMISRNGFHVHTCLPPGRWVDFDVGSALSRFGFPVTAANNVICVSEYERRLGRGREAKAFISILARYGIGAAVYSDGSFLIGESAFAGEFGHMRLDVKGPLCICGQRGCLDVFASGRTWPDEKNRSGACWQRDLSRRSRYLAIGLANLLKIFHPSVVIMNGIYNEYEPDVKRIMLEVLSGELAFFGISVPQVLFGEPVEMKTSIGAALRAADDFLESFLLRTCFAADQLDEKGAKAK